MDSDPDTIRNNRLTFVYALLAGLLVGVTPMLVILVSFWFLVLSVPAMVLFCLAEVYARKFETSAKRGL